MIPVPPALHAIIISPDSASIQTDATQQLDVTCSDQYGAAFNCPILTWTSSDTSKATVSPSGLVTGVAAGSTDITAGVSGVASNISTITVTLPPPALYAITISPDSASIDIGTTQQLQVSCTDQYGATFTCPELTWISGSPLVAAVSGGLVTGLAEGSSSITATASEITSNASVIMVTIPLPSPKEAGFGPLLVGGLVIGALFMGKDKSSDIGRKGKVESLTIKQIRESPTRPTGESPTQMSKTKSAQVSRSNISNN